MKHTFTCWLLATGLLVPVSAAPAQTAPAPPVQAQRPLPAPAHAPARPPGVPIQPHDLRAATARGEATHAARRPQRPEGEAPLSAPARLSQEAPVLSEIVIPAGGNTYQGPANRIDQATAITLDAAGNYYVTGYGPSLAPFTSNVDFITLKYAASGRQEWVVRYRTPGVSTGSRPVDVAVDAAGNVYVTGTSGYLTLKYSASGQLLWTASYTSPDGSSERPAKVVLDGAGNVYVAGTTTVKYSPDGQQLWTVPGGDVVVDAADNVYVSRSSGITKYTASGQPLWTTPGPGGGIHLDAAGQVYVTGTVGGGTNNVDYGARKYDGATGQSLWEARYNSANNGQDVVVDAAVDAAGNVYLTGSSNSVDAPVIATVKFSPTGQLLWASSYSSVPPYPYRRDEVRRLALDAAGNVYIIGDTRQDSNPPDFLTVKYASASGRQAWSIGYNSRGGPRDGFDEVADLAVDATGNVYVTGSSLFSGVFTGQFTTRKYRQAKVAQLWEARFTGPTASAEIAKDVVSDAAGNVYVTGYAYNGRNYDYATVKYAPSGAQLWEARYNGPADSEDLPTNVVVDTAGNVYVSGTSYSATESDYATLKYSPTGQQLWVARYNGPARGYDLAAKVAVDGAGNVLVTGSSDNGPNGSYDYATLKYAANGQPVWATRYNGPANSFDLAADLVVDEAGEVYVTGTTYSSTGSDYATLQYANASGQLVWEQTYDGPDHGYDEAAKLAFVGALRTVVVTGTSAGSTTTGYDFATLMYGASGGSPQWTSRYNDPANGDDVVAALAVTSQGQVVVAGTSYGGRSADYSTVRYTGNTGQIVWRSRYDGPAGSYDEAKALAVDAAGNAYVTGLSYNREGTTDYATLTYAPDAQPTTSRLLGEARHNGSGNSYDEAVAVAVDGFNNVYVTGSSLGSSTGYDFATLKFGPVSAVSGLMARAGVAPVSTRSAPLTVAAASGQLQELAVYPNPASGPTTIRFRPVLDGPAQVLVYNQLGQQVATLYAGTVRQGQSYQLSWNSNQVPAGLYTCALRVGSQRETVRLLLQH